MKKNTILALAVAAFVAGGGAVIAQTISVPQVSTVRPTLDRIQVIPNGQPSAQSVYASPAQITAVKGYYTSVPASLFTYTYDNATSLAEFRPAGTLAYGYITMAPNPSDGTDACVFSTQAVTTLYLTANTGQSIANAITGLTANTRYCYLYSQSAASWYRSQ